MQQPHHVHIVCNPAAGKGGAVRMLPRLERLLREAGYDVESTTTSAPGDATRIAAATAADVMLSLGGDGTLNEIVNGLGHRAACLGVVPAGSGNDFCKAVGVRHEGDVLAALRDMRCRQIDRAHADIVDEDGAVFGRYFVNSMGIGFDAAVAMEVSRSHLGTGVLRYLLAVLRTLRKYSSVPATVGFGNTEISNRMFLSCIGNGSTSGGGFRLTPDAVPDDGLLDLCHVSHVGVARVLRVLPRAMRGSHVHEPEVTLTRAAHFTVELSYPLPVHVDGEILTERARRLVVTIEPRALRFLSPAWQPG